MPICEFLNNATGQTVQGLNFGGTDQKVYEVDGVLVYAPYGGTSITEIDGVSTLNPLGLTCTTASFWNTIDKQNDGTCEYKITVENPTIGETKYDVYPFNEDGKVYELECMSGTFVKATCGGYDIETTWDGQGANECYRLKGTGEIISKKYEYIEPIDGICPPLCADGEYFDCTTESCIQAQEFILDVASVDFSYQMPQEELYPCEYYGDGFWYPCFTQEFLDKWNPSDGMPPFLDKAFVSAQDVTDYIATVGCATPYTDSETSLATPPSVGELYNGYEVISVSSVQKGLFTYITEWSCDGGWTFGGFFVRSTDYVIIKTKN